MVKIISQITLKAKSQSTYHKPGVLHTSGNLPPKEETVRLPELTLFQSHQENVSIRFH